MSKNDIEALLLENVITPEKFAMEIESLVSDQELNYLEAITDFCETNGISVEEISDLISNKLKINIEQQARELGLLKDKETSTKLL